MARCQNRFSGFPARPKPLKRLEQVAAQRTPLKRGVNESSAKTGAWHRVPLLQKLICARVKRIVPLKDPKDRREMSR